MIINTLLGFQSCSLCYFCAIFLMLWAEWHILYCVHFIFILFYFLQNITRILSSNVNKNNSSTTFCSEFSVCLKAFSMNCGWRMLSITNAYVNTCIIKCNPVTSRERERQLYAQVTLQSTCSACVTYTQKREKYRIGTLWNTWLHAPSGFVVLLVVFII